MNLSDIELIQKDNNLIHVRSGELVSCFEVVGKSFRGATRAYVLAGTIEGFQAIPRLGIREATHHIRLVTGERIPFNLR